MALPLLIGGVCIITSIIGTYFVRLGGSNNVMGAMYNGFLVSAVLSVAAIWFATSHALGGMEAPIAGTDFTGRDLFYYPLLGPVITGLRDRKSVVMGKSVSGRLDLGGGGCLKK